MGWMNKKLQINKLRGELGRAGIDHDTVDLDALVDSRLSYGENAQNIMNRYQGHRKQAGKSRKGSQGAGEGGNIDLRYAQQFHQSRSPQAQKQDEGNRNNRTFTEKQIAKRPSILDGWMRSPGRSDIFGIDVFSNSEPKRKKKHKRKGR